MAPPPAPSIDVPGNNSGPDDFNFEDEFGLNDASQPRRTGKVSTKSQSGQRNIDDRLHVETVRLHEDMEGREAGPLFKKDFRNEMNQSKGGWCLDLWVRRWAGNMEVLRLRRQNLRLPILLPAPSQAPLLPQGGKVEWTFLSTRCSVAGRRQDICRP
jgi:hypothetical protein